MSKNSPTPIAPLPPDMNFDAPLILKSLIAARSTLAELRGTAKSLPNPNILIDTLFLQEALASSEIENIVTTQDAALKVDLFAGSSPVEAKEVARYRDAMQQGYSAWQKNHFISEKMLIEMFRILKQRDDGYRKTPGTILRNEQTGQEIYRPPQEEKEIIRLMRELENFINAASDDLDPLIKMALIHHQFESIHPFPDGNGRVGRMLNVLYLTHTGLLDAPILYLSRAINATKPDYYRLLQAVRDDEAWEEWVIYMLGAVARTAVSTLRLVEAIRDLMQDTKHRMRETLPKIYSQDLLNNLFRHPYTRIDYLESSLGIHYNTAASYLKKLTQASFVSEQKSGRNNYYINQPLVDLFLDVSAEYSPQAERPQA